jgi:hypothetical protein
MSKIQQRIHDRVAAELLVRLWRHKTEEALPGLFPLRDISKSGMSLHGLVPVAVDESLDCKIELPNKDGVIRLPAVVRWRSESDPPCTGLEFVQSLSKDYSRLVRFMNDRIRALAAAPGAEKNRKFTRIPADLVARVRVISENDFREVSVRDLSRNGSSFDSPAALPPGTEIEIVMRLPGVDASYSLFGTVRWQEKSDVARTGVQFNRVLRGRRSPVEMYIQEHLGRGASSSPDETTIVTEYQKKNFETRSLPIVGNPDDEDDNNLFIELFGDRDPKKPQR